MSPERPKTIVPVPKLEQVPRLLPRPRRIFVNRNLRMDLVRTIGFDMDYTLARYRRERLEALAHRLTIEKLIDRGYPAEIRTLEYDPSFVIRGLTVDKQRGSILKLDRHHHVGRVFHGRRRLSKKDRRDQYRSEKLDFAPPRFALVDTVFALPEMCLYADLVDFFAARGGSKVDTWQLFDDTRESIDAAHADGSLKSKVKAALEDYVERDPLLGRTLHKLRSSGKKLFLLTNSHWDYTDAVMSFLLNGDLPEYPNWQSYFEVVVVAARKPSFFTDSEPFAELDEKGLTVAKPAKLTGKGRRYQGGNLWDMERRLGAHGEQVLYVGDHIYGDILRSKKASLWRAALVVEELEEEIRHSMEHQADFELLAELEQKRRDLDDLANLQRQSLSALERTRPQAAARHSRSSAKAKGSKAFMEQKARRDRTKKKLKSVCRRIEQLENRLDSAFNPNWGMVFKEGAENSRFGEQVEDYACLYTSRVSNFFDYSAYQYFRAPRDRMAHER